VDAVKEEGVIITIIFVVVGEKNEPRIVQQTKRKT
jgi:hypothetical protein